MTRFTKQIDSPVGTLTLVADDTALVAIRWPGEKGEEAGDSVAGESPVLRDAAAQLREYFAGTRQTFDLPLRMQGSDFQKKVWEWLRRIPYGRTWSYGELASAVGNPAASRAVGMANSRNPIPIVVPCHRVIGSNGRLTGFGGGLPAKSALLTLEGIEVKA
jgi:methylated-DNA-[protein]-cysteine S-methyltransferase